MRGLHALGPVVGHDQRRPAAVTDVPVHGRDLQPAVIERPDQHVAGLVPAGEQADRGRAAAVLLDLGDPGAQQTCDLLDLICEVHGGQTLHLRAAAGRAESTPVPAVLAIHVDEEPLGGGPAVLADASDATACVCYGRRRSLGCPSQRAEIELSRFEHRPNLPRVMPAKEEGERLHVRTP